MLRAKYWFLDMNGMIDQLVGLCYDFQVTRQDRIQEHIKPSVKTMEKKFYWLWRTPPWWSLQFGCYGSENLIPGSGSSVYDSNETNHGKLKEIFAHRDISKQIQSDNDPPLNSKEFAAFAEKRTISTPQRDIFAPRSQWTVECFMQILNKTKQAVQPRTGVTPYQAMSNRLIEPRNTEMKEEARWPDWYRKTTSTKRR